MARAAAVVALLAALAAGCGGSSRPGFAQARGWNVITEPGQIVSAANVPFARADRSESAPVRTVASLPRPGIVIWVQWLRRGRLPAEDRHYPRRPLPLRVASMTAVAPEGFTCPRLARHGCSTRALQARSEQWDVAVWVFFGAADPLPMQVAAADAELARLRLPDAAVPPAAATARCPRPSGTGWYDSTVRPASGSAGTTVLVSGRLPEGRQPPSEVVAYWNLDFGHWTTISSSSPEAAVAGSPVRFLGTRNVSGSCSYRVRVTIPGVAPGRYPLEVLYGNARFGASFAPVEFRVTKS